MLLQDFQCFEAKLSPNRSFSLIFYNAALTHTSRPYCDLKTSKIAFFFRKPFGFLSNFSRRRSGALQSCVFSMSSIRPFCVHDIFTATILRPQSDPTAIIGDQDATVLHSLRPNGDSMATIASLLRCCCDYGDSHGPNQDSTRMQSFCDCFVHVYNIRRRSATLWVLGFLVTTSLRPCCVHGDCNASWVVARTQ